MSKKVFKRLGDDTKKMEKNMKLYHVGLIVNLILIVLIVILVTIIAIFKPDIFRKNTNPENELIANLEYSDSMPYSDFKAVRSNNKIYIVGNANGTTYKIMETDSIPVILGTYKNRLYYYNDNGIYFINFEDEENFENIEWLKYRQYKASNTGETGILSIDKAYLIEDKIYFKYAANISNNSSTSGVLTLSVDSKNIDDAKQILPNVSGSNWSFSSNKEYIYYVENDKNLNKYSISGAASETLVSDAESINIYEDKALYLAIDSATKEPDNAIVQAATYYLYVCDLISGENTLIYESSVANVTSGGLKGFAEIFNGEVYYKKDNKIVKYSDGANQVIYSNDSSDTYIDEFKIVDSSTIQIKLQGGTIKYLKDGNLVDNI